MRPCACAPAATRSTDSEWLTPPAAGSAQPLKNSFICLGVTRPGMYLESDLWSVTASTPGPGSATTMKEPSGPAVADDSPTPARALGLGYTAQHRTPAPGIGLPVSWSVTR